MHFAGCEYGQGLCKSWTLDWTGLWTHCKFCVSESVIDGLEVWSGIWTKLSTGVACKAPLSQ